MSIAFMADVTKIRNHPDNPRKVLRNIEELAISIREHGLIQPVVLSPDLDRPEGHYLLHAGHRRVAAFRRLSLAKVPAVLRQVPATRTIEVMLVENLQRDDLTPPEIGDALKVLQHAHTPPLTQADMARRIGKSPGWVNAMILFAELNADDRAALAESELTQEQALNVARDRKASRTGRTRNRSERTVDLPSRGWHFAFTHPLAVDSRLVCDMRGHSRKSGRRIGGVACGQCWEDTIRASERGGTGAVDELLAAAVPDIDEVIVDQLCDRSYGNVSSSPAERLEALHRLLTQGVEPVTACGRLSLSGEAGTRAVRDVHRLRQLRGGHIVVPTG